MPFISKTNEKEFLYSVLNSDSFYTFMVNSSSSSTGSRKLVQPDLCNNYKFAYPRDNRVIQMYCEKAKAIFEEKDKIIKENHELASLRDFLLSMFING